MIETQDNPQPIDGNGETTPVTNSSASTTPTNSERSAGMPGKPPASPTSFVQPELFPFEQSLSDGLYQGPDVQNTADTTNSNVEVEADVEFFTAAELAAFLGVHYSSVTQAAAKGLEHFRDWSERQGHGTFEFSVMKTGSSKPRKRFFKVG